MFVPEFRKAAMESADAYLRYLKEHDKGISKLSVRSVSVSEPYVRLYLYAALPHSVELNFFFLSFYGDRFPMIRFTPKDYDEKSRCILLTPAKDQLHFFSTPPQHIHIISDFRFLVSRVLNWYGSYGTRLRIPREPPSVPPLPLEKLSGGVPSEEQYAAYQGVMSAPFSYVWGAPGTGKTAFVLSNCVLSYLLHEARILLVAPTNNALEQMLRAILPILDRYAVPFHRIRRAGIPSKQFRQQYPAVCGDLSKDMEMQKHTNALAQLRDLFPLYEAMEAYNRVENKLSSYRAICGSLDAAKEKYASSEKKLSDHKQSLQKLRAQESSLGSALRSLLHWQTTFPGKCCRVLHLSAFKENQEKIESAQKNFTRIKHSITALCSDIKEAEAGLTLLQSSKDGLVSQADTAVSHLLLDLSVPILAKKLQTVRVALKAADHTALHASRIFASFSRSYASFTSLFSKQCDPSKNYAQMKAEIQAHEEAISRLSAMDDAVLAVAMTADFFLSLDPSKLQYSHIFVDEAAYLSVIKFASLLSLNAPVTLFGDHMQLPPVCEMSQGEGFLPNGQDVAYLWSRSSVYFDAIVSRTPAELVFPGPAPSFSSMQLFTLTATYRFGAELSSVLSKYIYPFPLSSMASSVSLFYVACPRSAEDLNTSSVSEQNACAVLLKFLLQHGIDCASLTPYRKQLAKLISASPEAAAQERVLTVHASQGREWDIVLLSVVDGKRKFFMNSSIEIGRHVLNTAISRTCRAIVLLLDPSYWNGQTQMISELLEASFPLDISNPTPLLYS